MLAGRTDEFLSTDLPLPVIWACCAEETVPLPQRAARTVLADSAFGPEEKLATQSIRKQCGDRNFVKSLTLHEVDRTGREKRCPSAGELVWQLRGRPVHLFHTRPGESRSRDRHALLVLPATGEAEQPATQRQRCVVPLEEERVMVASHPQESGDERELRAVVVELRQIPAHVEGFVACGDVTK